jgi:hypothetical protein
MSIWRQIKPVQLVLSQNRNRKVICFVRIERSDIDAACFPIGGGVIHVRGGEETVKVIYSPTPEISELTLDSVVSKAKALVSSVPNNATKYSSASKTYAGICNITAHVCFMWCRSHQ